MNIREILKQAANKLNSAKIKNPYFEAEILLSHNIKKPREFLLAHGENKLTKIQQAKYKNLINKRVKGWPVAYLLGYKEFHGFKFTVDKNVLVPRPETELLVDEAIKLVSPDSTIIDVGTGSGCIIITLIRIIENLKLKIKKFVALDISEKALSVAKKNAKNNKIKSIRFLKGNLLEPILNNKIKSSKLLILANLPYGWKVWKNNCSMETKSLQFEPQKALFAGQNGLALYKKLFKQISELSTHNNSGNLLCEFDPRQTAALKKMLKAELPQAKFTIKKDLAGLNRLIIIDF